MTGQAWTVNSDDKRDQFLKYASELYEKHKYVTFEWKVGQPHRSVKQNNALHVYLRLLAEQLNNAGLDMRKVLKEGIDIPWTEESVKNHLWRPIQKVVAGQDSTTEPTSSEFPVIYETLDRHLASKFGISIPWPAREMG